MSLFTRPSVFIAILFGCFAVLLPRVLIPLFRPRPLNLIDNHLRRAPTPRTDNDDAIKHTPESSSQHYPDTNIRQQPSPDQNNPKSVINFALPMYTVGIAVFFIYTCCKYWAKRSTQEEDKLKLRYSTNNIQWSAQKRKFKYDINNRQSEDDEEDSYAGLDSDYVEYLKLKKQKEFDAEQTTTDEQRQMHFALDDMKNSLSFISSKLETNQAKKSLTNHEISQLQDRLASTETQMYKILNALDVASTKVNELTKNSRQSLEQTPQTFVNEEEYHLSSRSHSESEGSVHDEENSNSDENSVHQEEQVVFNNKQEEEEESSSSYEEEPNEVEEDDAESESSSERYGTMNTDYGCDPTIIEDYELDAIKKPDQTSDSRTKVQEWHQRNHSSAEQDQSIPNQE